MKQVELDLTVNPGLQPCDRCERIKQCGWFGSFCLCEACASIAAHAIGREAAGRAIARLAKLFERGKKHGKQGTGSAG